MKARNLFYFLLISVSILSCNENGGKVSPARIVQKLLGSKKQEGDKFSFSYPSDWKITKDNPVNATTVFYLRPEDLKIKIGKDYSVIEIYETEPLNFSFDQFVSSCIAFIDRRFEHGLQIMNLTDTAIHKFPSRNLSGNILLNKEKKKTSNTGNIPVLLCAINAGARYYLIFYNDLAGDYRDDYYNLLNSIDVHH